MRDKITDFLLMLMVIVIAPLILIWFFIDNYIIHPGRSFEDSEKKRRAQIQKERNVDNGVKRNHINKGDRFLKKEKYEEALAEYLEAYKFEESKSLALDIFLDCINIKSKLGRQQEAIEDCDREINLNPTNADLYVARGICNHQIGKYKEAVDDFNAALKHKSTDVIYFHRAEAQKALGNFAQAEEDYKEAGGKTLEKAVISQKIKEQKLDEKRKLKEKQMRDKETHNLYSQTSFKGREIEKEIKELNRQISEVNRFVRAKDYETALIKYEEIINNNSYYCRYTNIFMSCADICFKIERHRRAKYYYNQEIKYRPLNPDAYYGLANAEFELKRYEKAVLNYDKAISLRNGFSPHYVGRGLAKYELGLYKEAIKDFDRAIYFNPSNKAVYFHKANAEKELGLLDKAQENYQKAGRKIPKELIESENNGTKAGNTEVAENIKEETDTKKDTVIDLTICKAADLKDLAGFNAEKAKKFIRERSRGIIYYDLNSLAEAYEIQPHQMVKLLDLNIVFAKQIVSRGRTIDF